MFKFFCLSILLFAFILPALPQAPPPSSGNPQTKISDTFTSIEGGFKIGLKNQILGYQPLSGAQSQELGQGGLFSFREPEIQFFIGYINLEKQINTHDLNEKLLQIPQALFGYKLEKPTTLKSEANSKKILDITGEYGVNHWIRFVNKDDKLIVLIARYTSDKPISRIKEVYESLELFSSAELIAESLRKATPAKLPQSPKITRKTTDAEDEELKGKVKFVRTRFKFNEPDEGCEVNSGQLNLEQYFDTDGNLVKQVRYGPKELPLFVTMFGYIDGKRVSKVGTINYSSNPPAPAPPASTKPRDQRFSTYYEYKYDKRNRMTEKRVFDNRGELDYKIVWEYLDKKVVVTTFENNGEVRWKRIEILNDNGQKINQATVDNELKPKSAPYKYTYKCVDKNGNWTKQTQVKIPLKSEKNQQTSYSTKIREITYYE